MTRRGVVNSIVALVAILVTGALAVGAVISGPPSETSSDELVAAGVDGRAAVRAESDALTGTSVTTLPVPTVPTTRPARTTLPPIPTTNPDDGVGSDGAGLVDDPADPGPVDPRPTGATGDIAPVTAPPAVSPSSWTMVAEGVTVTARIEPAAPRVGDTVAIFYTATAAGDLCCGSSVVVDDAIVAMNPLPLGPHACPMERATSWNTSVVASTPGPFSFLVYGSHVERFCTGPPSMPVNVTLRATFQVLPAS